MPFDKPLNPQRPFCVHHSNTGAQMSISPLFLCCVKATGVHSPLFTWIQRPVEDRREFKHASTKQNSSKLWFYYECVQNRGRKTPKLQKRWRDESDKREVFSTLNGTDVWESEKERL